MSDRESLQGRPLDSGSGAALVPDPAVKRLRNGRGRKVILGEDGAGAILQQFSIELRILLPSQGQDGHFGGLRDQVLHRLPAAGIGQIEIGKNQIHSMLTKQRKCFRDAFSMNKLNPRPAQFGKQLPKQENIQRVVFDEQEADAVLIVHYGGKVTFLNQNVSIVCTISLNLLKSTGFAR